MARPLPQLFGHFTAQDWAAARRTAKLVPLGTHTPFYASVGYVDIGRDEHGAYVGANSLGAYVGQGMMYSMVYERDWPTK